MRIAGLAISFVVALFLVGCVGQPMDGIGDTADTASASSALTGPKNLKFTFSGFYQEHFKSNTLVKGSYTWQGFGTSGQASGEGVVYYGPIDFANAQAHCGAGFPGYWRSTTFGLEGVRFYGGAISSVIWKGDGSEGICVDHSTGYYTQKATGFIVGGVGSKETAVGIAAFQITGRCFEPNCLLSPFSGTLTMTYKK